MYQVAKVLQGKRYKVYMIGPKPLERGLGPVLEVMRWRKKIGLQRKSSLKKKAAKNCGFDRRDPPNLSKLGFSFLFALIFFSGFLTTPLLLFHQINEGLT